MIHSGVLGIVSPSQLHFNPSFILRWNGRCVLICIRCARLMADSYLIRTCPVFVGAERISDVNKVNVLINMSCQKLCQHIFLRGFSERSVGQSLIISSWQTISYPQAITYFLNKRSGAFWFLPVVFHLNETSWSLQNGHLYFILSIRVLTYWFLVMHICASKLTIIGPDNGLSRCRRQAIIWTNAAILLIRTLGTNVSEIFSEINTFSFKKYIW